jgi:hypothetical protein
MGKSPDQLMHDKTRQLNGRYANAAIGPVNAIIKGYIYPELFQEGSQNGPLISSMAFAGIIIGQLCESSIHD